MSTSNVTHKISSEGNGSTTTFSFNYPINVIADVTVELLTEATGVGVVVAEGVGLTQFTVTSIDVSTGFLIIEMGTAPSALEWLTIYRSSPMTQESTIPIHNSIEGDLDISTFRDMSQQEQIDRSLKIAVNDDVTYTGHAPVDTTLPSVEGAGVGDMMVLDATKTAFEWSTPSDAGTVPSAADTLADNKLIRGDVSARGIQDSGVNLDDSDNMSGVGTLGVGAITTTGALHMNGASIGHTAQSSTGDGTTVIDWNLGNIYLFTFGAQNETTFDFTNPTLVGTFMLKMIQDGGGNRTVTTWDTDIDWAGGGTAPVLSTGGGEYDWIHFVWDGTKYGGTTAVDFQ